MIDDTNENNDAGNYMINNKTTTSKSFGYKAKVIGNMAATNNTLETEILVPLKYLSKFWRSLDLSLINCEIEIDLPWPKDCILSEISITPEVLVNPVANPHTNQVPPTQPSGVTLQINSVMLYVPVVTLSVNNNIIF